MVLDLGLPDLDGIEVIEGVRGWSQVPIIVLSARAGQGDKVIALDAGADDYVTKPFGMDELLARLRAALRRAEHGGVLPVVSTEHFSIDFVSKEVSGHGRPARPADAHAAAHHGSARPRGGKLVGQRELLKEVWGPNYETETNYLRVCLAQLRRKLEPDPAHPRYLITEPGMGYRFGGR